MYICLKKYLICVFFRFATEHLENSKAFLARSNWKGYFKNDQNNLL